MPEPQYHFQWWHSFLGLLGLTPALALKKVRSWVVELVKKFFKIEVQKFVTPEEFKEHKDGDKLVLNTILHGLDQNARIVQAAAIEIADSAKESREIARLSQISTEEHRREFDGKFAELHEKINQTNITVAGLKATNELVIELAKKNLGKAS